MTLRNQINNLAPWFINGASLRSLLEVPDEKLDLEFADMFELRPESSIDDSGVAMIHVHGTLTRSAPPIYSKLGLVTEYGAIQAEAAELIDRGAQAAMFVFSTPGGSCTGCPESADFIQSLSIPTAAHATGLMCSAGYYQAASCDIITADPSAPVGNIGTISVFRDDTELKNSIGITDIAFTNEGADIKDAGVNGLDAGQRAFLQDRVNQLGKEFQDHVKANRSVDPEVFRAGWYSGKRAFDLGLVDGIGGLGMALDDLRKRI